MTKKDYVKLAGALKLALSQYPYVEGGQETHGAVLTAARKVADVLQEDNPRFQRNVFMAAVMGLD